MQPIF